MTFDNPSWKTHHTNVKQWRLRSLRVFLRGFRGSLFNQKLIFNRRGSALNFTKHRSSMTRKAALLFAFLPCVCLFRVWRRWSLIRVIGHYFASLTIVVNSLISWFSNPSGWLGECLHVSWSETVAAVSSNDRCSCAARMPGVFWSMDGKIIKTRNLQPCGGEKRNFDWKIFNSSVGAAAAAIGIAVTHMTIHHRSTWQFASEFRHR